MKNSDNRILIALAACAGLVAASADTHAQNAPAATPNDTLVSPLVAADGRVTLSIYAPNAEEVSVVGDWQITREAIALQKNDQGVWSVEIGPLPADFYSYTLIVDRVRTLDPKNPMIKQGNTGVDNLFLLPGDGIEFADNQPVPHGQVRQVWYSSSALGMQRRMHVYTPPGYDRGSAEYPVLYLLHGGGDEDSGWSSIGRAGFILDNLIAAKKAVPMLVVMPNGSLPPPPAGAAADLIALQGRFVPELIEDVIPFVEQNFRVRANPNNRAIAGLSMGGIQTTLVFTRHPEQFSYAAIWSAGLFQQPREEFVMQNAAFLGRARQINRGTQLLSIVVGEDDFARPGTEELVAILNEHDIDNEFELTGGGHTWINWRRYLNDLVPQLFH
jgi:enterochelin esterase family protein